MYCAGKGRTLCSAFAGALLIAACSFPLALAQSGNLTNPEPPGCGDLGAPCCTYNTPRGPCHVQDSFCLPPNATSAADWAQYTCQELPRVESCGQPWGLCAVRSGGWATAPGLVDPTHGLQCPPEREICPDGYSCQSLPESSLGEVLGTCVPVPPGCGLEDGPCCPGGVYQGGLNVSEFGGFCREDGIYCTADYHGQDSDEWRCKRWPSFPDDCGGPGKPCCPDGYMHWYDASANAPPNCQVGSYCLYERGGATTIEKDAIDAKAFPVANGTCVANLHDCGQMGKACCISNGYHTWYTCHGRQWWCKGAYEGTGKDVVCQPCPSNTSALPRNAGNQCIERRIREV